MHADQAAAKEKDRAEWLAILDKRIKENEAREAQEDAEAKARMTPAEYKKFAEARKQAKDRAAENRLRQMEVEDGVAADKQHAIDAVNVCGLLSGDLWVKCIIRASDVQVRSQA
ncbi:MAG TPA: hypothetical protein VHT04_03950 [Stellaceae bacterium]|jgi:hypothetical protein|nr:hypothetical protein [Stellaceae bacterium]